MNKKTINRLNLHKDTTLLIRSSYHGTGDAFGYNHGLFHITNNKLTSALGYLYDNGRDLNLNIGETIQLGSDIYQIVNEFDSPIKKEEKNEVIYYELVPFNFKPNHIFTYGKLEENDENHWTRRIG